MAPANGAIIEGNVGIGVSNPQNKLDIEGGAYLGYETNISDFGGLLKSGFYQDGGNAITGDVPDQSHTWSHLITTRHDNTGNNHQLQIGASYNVNDRLFFRKIAAGNVSSNPAWNEIATRGTNVFTGQQIVGGLTTNGVSHYQFEGATYRNPGDHTPTLLLRADNPSLGVNGFRPALTLYNFNGNLNSTVGLAFASNEEAGIGNTANLAGIMAIKESVGTNNGWCQGGLSFFTKNMGQRIDAMSIGSTGRISFLQPEGGDPNFTGLESPTSSGGRAQVVLSSSYSDLVIASSQPNHNHGSTLTFATYNPSDANDYRKFVVNQGNWGDRRGFLDFGYSDAAGRSNPHSSINGSDNVLVLDGFNKRVGIGTQNPGAKLDVVGAIWNNQGIDGWGFKNGCVLGTYGQTNATTFPLYIPTSAQGLTVTNTSDAAFFGLISRGANSNDYNAVIAWGDDAADDLEFRFNNSTKASINSGGQITLGNDRTTFCHHNPYGDAIGEPIVSTARLEVGGWDNGTNTVPAILRIHQWGSGAAEFFKPQGTVLYLRETPGGGNTWFNRFEVQTYRDERAWHDASVSVAIANGSAYLPSVGFHYPGNYAHQISLFNTPGLGAIDQAGTNGSPFYAQSFNGWSDINAKKDVADLGTKDLLASLDNIMKIRSISYRFNTETDTEDSDPTTAYRKYPHIGFEAQSLPKEVYSEVLNATSTKEGKGVGLDFKGYGLGDMDGLLVAGVKALNIKVEEQNKLIEDLRKQIEDLKKK